MFTYVFIFVRVFIVPATSTYCVYDSLRGYPNLMGSKLDGFFDVFFHFGP
jgi:hypothetical protein